MRLPAISVILIFVVMVVIGVGITPLLNIQYTPTEKRKNLTSALVGLMPRQE